MRRAGRRGFRVRDVANIALGSNVGDRAAHLAAARDALSALPRSRLVGASEVEETEPVGGVPQEAYLNQMVALETVLTPRELLSALHDIEECGGRVRGVRWGPRTIDLDIVLFEGHEVHDPDLVVPHPELATRDFWQRELAQLRRSA